MQNEDLFNKFLELLGKLEKENVDYVLIGGFAVILHGMPRLTEDLDIFIRHSEKNISKLQTVLYEIFDDESIFEITHKELENYAVIRYGSNEGFYIDIISKIGEAFSFDDLKYEITDIQGTKVKIATAETLFKLKEKTFRAIDQNDLIFLKELIKKKNER